MHPCLKQRPHTHIIKPTLHSPPTTGDYIELSIGLTLSIGTMTAAALGNVLADVAGLNLGGLIEVCAMSFSFYRAYKREGGRTTHLSLSLLLLLQQHPIHAMVHTGGLLPPGHPGAGAVRAAAGHGRHEGGGGE